MAELTMHAARMAMNRNPEVRERAENYLKVKERATFMQTADATEEAFEKHWKMVRPERMHEGAIEAVTAAKAQMKNVEGAG